MAEFTLPANSVVKKGKIFEAPTAAKNTKRFKIYRYDPDDGQNPRTPSKRTSNPPLFVAVTLPITGISSAIAAFKFSIF